MFIWEFEKEVENDIRNHAFDGWFGCAKERHPVLQNYPCIDDLFSEFKDRDVRFAERHNSILEALIKELQSCPHESPSKILIYIFIPLLVRIAENRAAVSEQAPADIHATVVFCFLDVVSGFPLERLGSRIFGNIRHRLENRLRKEWMTEDEIGELEYLDDYNPDPDDTDRNGSLPLDAFEDRESARWLMKEVINKEILEDDDLELIIRCDIQGVALTTIAREKNLPVEYVRKRRQRALAALRDRFKKYF